MILITEPRNAPAEHRFLVAQVLEDRPEYMRIARCQWREHADGIARAWRDGLYTPPGELRRCVPFSL